MRGVNKKLPQRLAALAVMIVTFRYLNFDNYPKSEANLL